jgi:hypothetical protein
MIIGIHIINIMGFVGLFVCVSFGLPLPPKSSPTCLIMWIPSDFLLKTNPLDIPLGIQI